MASFQTFFRTVVMLATLGLLAKVWYHYGLTFEELKGIGTSIAEVAQKEWADYWQKPVTNSLADDPRLPTTSQAPAPFVPQGGPIEPLPHAPGRVPNTAGGSTVQLAGGVLAEIVPVAPSTPWPTGTAPEPTRLPAEPSTDDARLRGFLERLAAWGVRDQELAPWGSRGELVRFHCNVPWANSPAYSRHFEAVAATPLAAVEQVAAEIEAWRGGQR